MNEFFKNFSLFLKENNMKNISKLSDNESFEGFFPADYFGDEKLSAEIIEGKDFETKKVTLNTNKSEFKYFLDGIERVRTISTHPQKFIPVVFAYISASVLQRNEKIMCSCGIEKEDYFICLPYKENKDAPESYFELSEVAKYGFKHENTGLKDEKTGNYPILPQDFERSSHSIVAEKRRAMERDLSEQWINSNFKDGWLFIDGRLEPLSKKLKSELNAVGVIKSHRTSYFSAENQMKIFSLKAGERTCVFQPKKNDEKENVYSWYLRLYDNKFRGNADFGIVRVEIAAKESLLSKIDEISGWILLERNPIAFPAGRWDRMIYPVKYCEDYLKSKAPSLRMLESLNI